MTLAWIPAGRLAVDDSFTFPATDELVVAGVAAEVRYASRPDNNPKNWTAAQIAERHAAGIGVVMIHEQTASDSLGGETAGVADARVFVRYADLIGYPRTAPAMCACDTSPKPIMVEYAAAFERTVRAEGWSIVGVYGGVDLIGWCADDDVCTGLLWQAYGWSAIGGSSPADALRRVEARWPGRDYELLPSNERNAYAIDRRAHVFQRFGRYDIPLDVVTSSIDENIVRRPLPVWLPGATTPDPPAIEESPMSYALVTVKLPNGTVAGATFRADIDGPAATGRPGHLVHLTEANVDRCASLPKREVTLNDVAACTVTRIPAPGTDHAFTQATGRDWSLFDFLDEVGSRPTSPAVDEDAIVTRAVAAAEASIVPRIPTQVAITGTLSP